MKYIMSKPIPIKKEEEKSSFFFNWYKKEKEVEKNVEEDEIFEMDDDELPPNVKKEESKNGLDAKLSDSDERDDELSDDEDNESVSEDEEQDEICFGFPCSNNKFYGYCKKCEKDSMCELICESVKLGMNDMREDIEKLWKKDVVKVWTAFLTVCYFNMPHHAMFAAFMYYIDQKFKEHEKNMVKRIQIENLNDVDSDNEDFSDEDTEKEEIKKCV